VPTQRKSKGSGIVGRPQTKRPVDWKELGSWITLSQSDPKRLPRDAGLLREVVEALLARHGSRVTQTRESARRDAAVVSLWIGNIAHAEHLVLENLLSPDVGRAVIGVYLHLVRQGPLTRPWTQRRSVLNHTLGGIELQRDWLVWFIGKEPLAERTQEKAITWITTHWSKIVSVLAALPCLCSYRTDSAALGKFLKQEVSERPTNGELVNILIAYLHGLKVTGVEARLRKARPPAPSPPVPWRPLSEQEIKALSTDELRRRIAALESTPTASAGRRHQS
jgi:hypothetical protein